MKASHFLLVALAALAVGACAPTTNTDADDVGEAKEAVTTYADPSAVKTAADAGTCVPGAIIVNDVPLYPVLSGGVWAMSDQGGDFISRGACLLIKGGTVNTAPGEYQYTIDTSRGTLQLAEVDGAAVLTDP